MESNGLVNVAEELASKGFSYTVGVGVEVAIVGATVIGKVGTTGLTFTMLADEEGVLVFPIKTTTPAVKRNMATPAVKNMSVSLSRDE